MKHFYLYAALAGGLAGIVNGLFGGGGGMILVPMLVGYCGLSQRQGFATSVAIIFPLCALSSALYLFQGSVTLTNALPYLIGGLIGGILGGQFFGKINVLWLKKAFALFILYGGVKALFFS